MHGRMVLEMYGTIQAALDSFSNCMGHGMGAIQVQQMSHCDAWCHEISGGGGLAVTGRLEERKCTAGKARDRELEEAGLGAEGRGGKVGYLGDRGCMPGC